MDTTYKIIGGDGVEYGPVSLSEMKAWIVDGRISGRSQVWRSDQARWLMAAQYQEFYPEIGQIDAMMSSKGSAQGAAPVGFWARVGAYLLDLFLLSMLYFLLWGPAKPQMDPTTIKTFQDLADALRPHSKQLLTELGIQTLYFVVMTGQFGATLGKMAIRARVVNQDGSPIGFVKALLRGLCGVINLATCFLGYLVIAFREDKRGLHDMIAGTRVVYRE